MFVVLRSTVQPGRHIRFSLLRTLPLSTILCLHISLSTDIQIFLTFAITFTTNTIFKYTWNKLCVQLVLLLFFSSNTSTSTTTKPTIADRSIDRLCSGRTGEAASSWRPERRSAAAATCRGWWVGCGGGRGRGARIGGGGGGEGKDGGVVGGWGGRRAVAALSSTHARSYEQIVIITFDLHIIRSGWY